ncbi:hypothetical protein HW537_09315 [Asaia siamensis]
MSDGSSRYAAFRLNIAQQRKRAKDLLKAWQRQHPDAVNRMIRYHSRPITASKATLADAQSVIARELGLSSWPRLLHHLEASAACRSRIARKGVAPDAGMSTLHLRCGNDIESPLRKAGFNGDFESYTDPLYSGPVTQTENWLDRRADHIAESLGRYIDLDRTAIFTRLLKEENILLDVTRYERVVLWFEHDLYDQLILARILTVIARHRPRHLELVSTGIYPGATRFIGLGQLPPEALLLLWDNRKPVSPAALKSGCATWAALCAPTPFALLTLAQAGTPALPELGRALARFAREYPWAHDGLALSQRIVLGLVADKPMAAGAILQALTHQAEPLPWLTDLMFRDLLESLRNANEPAISITPRCFESDWATDEVCLTPAGRDVYSGKRNWNALAPAERWLGGVRIGSGAPRWVWNETSAAFEVQND